MGQPYFAFVFTPNAPFVANGFCSPEMVMFTDDGDVTLSSTFTGTPPTISLARPGKNQAQTLNMYPSDTVNITVGKGKSPNITFAVCDGTGSYSQYYLCGVFLRKTAGTGAPNFAVFPSVSINVDDGATVMQLTDRNNVANAYNFYVLVQNAAGDYAFIDPKITNQTN